MPVRLLIAYLLILLLVTGGAGVVWWNVYHSRGRTYVREQVRRRRSEAARLARAKQEDRGSG
jgi:hypothetical protein